MIESIHFDLIKKHGPGRGNAICLGDQRPSNATGYTTSAELFRALGYQKFIDIDYNGEAQVNHDLNLPVAQSLWGIGSLVYDGGTSEHVANIGQSLTNIVRILEVGGTLIQAVPVNCYGPSYYGLDPLLLRDFYAINGFKEIHLTLYHRQNIRMRLLHAACRFLPQNILDKCKSRLSKSASVKSFIFLDNPRDIKEYKPVASFRQVPITTHALYVGKKISEGEIQWPHQSIYPSVD